MMQRYRLLCKKQNCDKDHVFHTNYVYKIIGFEGKNVKLKDEFNKKVYQIEINKLDKTFALTLH